MLRRKSYATKEICNDEKLTMLFDYELTEDIFQGKTIVADDKSILFLPDTDIGPFELYLSDWEFLIRTGSICVNVFRYFTGYFFDERIIDASIVIPQSQKGKIFFESGMGLDELKTMLAIHYENIFPFCQSCYFDKNTNWFVVGEINAVGTAIEFATNNIAIIDNQNNLRAVYVKLSFDKN